VAVRRKPEAAKTKQRERYNYSSMSTTIINGPDQTRVKIWDVSEHNHGEDIDFTLMEAIRHAPAWLTSGERLMLFTLIYCLRPRRYLEIGVLYGGSCLIVAKAMDAVKSEGTLVLVDPDPKVEDSNWRQMEHRSILVRGRSPAVLGQAERLAGGKFDFIFIDANHETTAVMRDANGVIPHLADGAHILFHDGFRTAVSRAIDRFVSMHSASIVDFGALTREFTQADSADFTIGADGSPVKNCGFRLVQYRRRHGRRIPVETIRGIWFRLDSLFKWLYHRMRRLASRLLRQ
jgi:predicted O-methyltransferase YrrM